MKLINKKKYKKKQDEAKTSGPNEKVQVSIGPVKIEVTHKNKTFTKAKGHHSEAKTLAIYMAEHERYRQLLGLIGVATRYTTSQRFRR